MNICVGDTVKINQPGDRKHNQKGVVNMIHVAMTGKPMVHIKFVDLLVTTGYSKRIYPIDMVEKV